MTALDKPLVAALLIFSLTVDASAYIDPGTGSVVTTAILGFFAAAAYTFRKYMYRIRDIFSFRKSAGTKRDERR